MIGKTEILFRIQHLQQSAGRIAVILPRQLIHLIQNHNRIGGTAPLDALHDPPRHCAYVSATVSADLSLIPDAAQTDADVFPVQ